MSKLPNGTGIFNCPICGDIANPDRLLQIVEVEFDSELHELPDGYEATMFQCVGCHKEFSLAGNFMIHAVYNAPVPLDLSEIAAELEATSFRSVIQLPFLTDQNYVYFQGYEDGTDIPVQIRINKNTFFVYTRSHTEDGYYEHNDLEYRPNVEDHRKLMKSIADELKAFLLERNMWHGVTIFFNGKAFSEDEVLDNVNPTGPFVNCNPETLTVSFYENQLYEAFSNGDLEIHEALKMMFSKYGYYYELRHKEYFSIYPFLPI
ncbi:hypothetical protein [Paenibacillus sp. NPDC093718]|uniref:hypothetical protein n=1 Tax=Paenibacillus sp. NPDC093718 TaxID=3390601 RepID=UPI003D060954